MAYVGLGVHCLLLVLLIIIILLAGFSPTSMTILVLTFSVEPFVLAKCPSVSTSVAFGRDTTPIE